MNQVIKLKKLSSLSYFSRNTLSQVLNITDKNLYETIQRWIRKGLLIQLKRGLYVTREYYNNNARKDDYYMFIANKLKEPSYLSLEFILQKYGIISESIFGYSSITLKLKRNYLNEFGTFIYRNITERLFTGFTIQTYGNYEIKEATKMKALFDYLYLKLLRIQAIDLQLLRSYRFNLDKLTKKEEKELLLYCNLTEIKKYINLLSILKDAYDI